MVMFDICSIEKQKTSVNFFPNKRH